MFKTVLVPVTGAKGDAIAMETAYLAGRLFDAHLACLHICSDLPSLHIGSDQLQTIPMAGPGSWESGLLAAELYADWQEENGPRREAARRMFNDFCMLRKVPVAIAPGPTNVSASFRQTSGDIVKTIIEEAAFHDLVALARLGEEGGLSVEELGAVILAAGKPILLGPPMCPENLGSTLAIAWKQTPEAARAVAAAMPLIERAAKVVVLEAFDSHDDPRSNTTGERLVAQLSWHGVDAESHRVVMNGRTAAEAVLDEAHARGADMLIMGAYGHARVREFVLGGFTRHVLKLNSMPVLLFH